MKKNIIFLAFGVMAPFMIVPIYYIFIYGNNADSSNADLAMFFTMAFFGVPCAVFFLGIFILRMIYLKVKHLPIKQEFMDFIGFLGVFIIIAFALVFLSNLFF